MVVETKTDQLSEIGNRAANGKLRTEISKVFQSADPATARQFLDHGHFRGKKLRQRLQGEVTLSRINSVVAVPILTPTWTTGSPVAGSVPMTWEKSGVTFGQALRSGLVCT